MAVWIIACFLALHCHLSLSVPTADTKTVADTSLTDKLSHLERLVHHLDTAVHRLERGTGQRASALRHHGTELELVIRKDFDVRPSSAEGTDNDQCADLRAEWREVKQTWEIEKQALTKLLKETLQKQDSENGTGADGETTDTINSRLTEVIHQVENLKSSNAELQEAQSSLTADIQTLHNSVNADLQTLREANVQQDQAIQEAGSSVYVRWGNSHCPNSTRLVYPGVVGGSHSEEVGGASNPLCMSLSPVSGGSRNDYSVPSREYSAIYGAEYQTFDSHANMDPVCAVCRAPRSTVLMVPGTNRCQSGWTLEYSGFLMAGAYRQTAPTEYICVDSAFEGRADSSADKSGYLLFFSVAICGTLPCGPYVLDHVVTCAVCSK